MRTIKYFCHYDTSKNISYNRYYALSASQKIEYLYDKFNSIGYNVDIISLSSTRNPYRYSAQKIDLNYNTTAYFFSNLSWGNRLQRILSRFYISLNIILFVLFKLKCGETVLLYHSLEYANVILQTFKIKKINLILQLEELYQDVVTLSKSKTRLENKIVSFANALILSNSNLENITLNKPYITLNGNYTPIFKSIEKEDINSKIHLVYAGTFMKEKGIERVLLVAKYLSKKYVVHIYGFGSNEEIEFVKKSVCEINKASECMVVYEGRKTGDVLIDEIARFHYGLSFQDTISKFNDTSFPSKILTYLRVGLTVISTKVESIYNSEISDIIYFCPNESPSDIANYISGLNPLNATTIYEKLSQMDSKFQIDLDKFISLNYKEPRNEK